MAIIGFIVLLLLGIYLVFAGAAWAIFNSELTGRSGWGGPIHIILGIVLVVVACSNAPFTVLIKG